MSIPAPHFLLFSEARGKKRQGQWRFVLQAADGSATLEASDAEPETGGERLELLAVIRGLEALDQPSHVTLFTPSKYVSRGIAYGLEEWRRNDWTWECFGEMVPVKNRDLWQRLDRALNYHTIEFRVRRPADGQGDGETERQSDGELARPEKRLEVAASVTVRSHSRRSGRRFTAQVSRSLRETAESWKLRLGQLGTAFLPKPWLQ
jgi:ribonuclease HI